LPKSLAEVRRVARVEADIIFGIPADNFFMKTFFWLKKSQALKSHINSQKKLINMISQEFKVIEVKKINILGINIYVTIKCRK